MKQYIYDWKEMRERLLAMKAMGWTDEQFAVEIKVSSYAVRKWLKKGTYPHRVTLDSITKFLNKHKN